MKLLLSSFHSVNTEDKPQQGLLTSTSQPGDQVTTLSAGGLQRVAAVRRPVASRPHPAGLTPDTTCTTARQRRTHYQLEGRQKTKCFPTVGGLDNFYTFLTFLVYI